MIFKIALAELRHLFYSPIAWLLIIVFYVLCGFHFVNPLVDFARIQEANIESNPNYEFEEPISIAIFVQSVQSVLKNLYLFIPLLTMGIINREVHSGAIKLLYSSPIRSRDLVFGKYLGLVIFNLILVVIVASIFITGFFTIQQAEISWYFTIVLALFLLANTYVAIGMFMSALTNYQLVAAMLTFMVLYLLNFVGGVWQDYDFFRDLSYFLTLTNKAEIMISGLITTRDIFYFLLITSMFLGFTLIKLKSTQASLSWKQNISRYTILFLGVLMLGYISSRPGNVGYWDVSKGKVNTIHPNLQNLLKKLDGSPLTVTFYANILGRNVEQGLPRSRNNYIWKYWEMYVRYYPNVILKYENFFDINEHNGILLQHLKDKSPFQLAMMIAELVKVDITDFKQPEAIRKLIDLSGEDYGPILEFEYKGKKVLARTYPDVTFVPNQANIAGTIQRLIDEQTPRIVFPTGHFERSPNSLGERGYGNLFNNKANRRALINTGVDIDTISLVEESIPASTSILLVADPKSAYSSVEKDKIITYLRNGGNAFIIGEPGKQHLINDVLAEIGVTIEKGIIVENNRNQTADNVLLLLTKAGANLADEKLMVDARNDKGPTGFSTVSAASLAYKEKDGFKIEPIYEVFSQEAWIETGHFVSDSAAPIYAAMEGDIKKDKYVVALKLSRTINNKEQRIVVIGDADNTSNYLHEGIDFSRGIISWLLYNEYPVYTNYPAPKDLKITIGFESARVLYVVYLYVLPSLLFLSGIIILIRRSRK